MQNFEEVPYPGESTNSDIFYKTRPKKPSSNPSSREWKNKLNLEPYPLMDNRKVEIKEIQLVNDGYLSSHKEYKIRSYTTEGADEKEISRRYSDFEWLVSQLTTKFPGVIVPPLPEKNPLTNINQEKASFLESRKRGLLLFLEKMLQHPDLRYTPDFISFLMCNDIEFNNIVEKSKKPGVIPPIITSLLEQIPAVTSVSFFSNIINKFSEGEKVRREKSENDIKIEHHESYINFLEGSVSELTKYAGQMASAEKDQANMLLDLSNNLNEISKFDKNNKLEICKKMSMNTENCSEVQKEHAKYFNDELETKLKEVNAFIVAAQEAIKRRNDLKDIIEKNSTQISELERQRNAKYLDLLRVNEENRVHLEEIDEVLLDELENFEPEIITEIDKVARDFMAHQTRYAKEMYHNWIADEN